MNLGVDFGSTYSTFSVYSPLTGNVEEQTVTQNGSPFIPSLAGVDCDERICTGFEAKELQREPDAQVFSAFKMLLPEKNRKLLEERGYSDAYSPRIVAKHFLDQHMRIILNNFGKEIKPGAIQNLVICAPEVWNERAGTLDGRAVLRDICKELDYVDNFRVVSEPAAASAYFAYTFQKMTGKPFEGSVLIIDYGGGTLDITLTSVSVAGTAGEVEISVLARTGAGENRDGKIGDAGIAYMEAVVVLALEQAGFSAPNRRDEAFVRAVNRLEGTLQTRTQDIRVTFDEFDDDPGQLLNMPDKTFFTVTYQRRRVEITYQHLYRAYEQVIFKVLDEKLNEMIDHMEAHGLPYMDGGQDRFKIALVGGFSRFELVRRQVWEKFCFSSADRRLEHIGVEKRESAISLGAALLADGRISIRNTAPYSIGIPFRNQSGKIMLGYGIVYRQDIEFGKVYTIRNADGSDRIFSNAAGKIDKFVISYDDNTEVGVPLPLRSAFVRRLSDLPNAWQSYGFSLDASGVVTFHVLLREAANIRKVVRSIPIELSSYSEMFDLTQIEEVIRL